jgi:hypothetical protein
MDYSDVTNTTETNSSDSHQVYKVPGTTLGRLGEWEHFINRCKRDTRLSVQPGTPGTTQLSFFLFLASFPPSLPPSFSFFLLIARDQVPSNEPLVF